MHSRTAPDHATDTLLCVATDKIAAYLYLLDEAFGGRGLEQSNESQSLVWNNQLRSLLGTDDRWRWQQFEDPSP